jgi:hypothetical protein
MTAFSALGPATMSANRAALQTAVLAYLGRYRGANLSHIDSDLRIFLTRCTIQELDPLTARRTDIEWYVRWLRPGRAADLGSVGSQSQQPR